MYLTNPKTKKREPQYMGNARLIAASPDGFDLLARLAALYAPQFEAEDNPAAFADEREINAADFLDKFTELRPEILAYIKKVRGEG